MTPGIDYVWAYIVASEADQIVATSYTKGIYSVSSVNDYLTEERLDTEISKRIEEFKEKDPPSDFTESYSAIKAYFDD